MFEERRWGSYRVLDYQTLDDGSEFLTKRLRIRAGKNLSYQYHMQRSEIWTVIVGRGELVLDGRFIPMKPGDVAHIPVGAKHAIRAVTELEIVEVQLGTRLIEEDIVRLFFSWEELLRSLSE
ncbi:phosphomannose isomerase type II C-terminal cupin domain [Brevibacillus composti]|nr:phosphomannose isomerase type II C-terminal cupin domain [Brevibacillus composti]